MKLLIFRLLERTLMGNGDPFCAHSRRNGPGSQADVANLAAPADEDVDMGARAFGSWAAKGATNYYQVMSGCDEGRRQASVFRLACGRNLRKVMPDEAGVWLLNCNLCSRGALAMLTLPTPPELLFSACCKAGLI
jgi:hypothetical protein